MCIPRHDLSEKTADVYGRSAKYIRDETYLKMMSELCQGITAYDHESDKSYHLPHFSYNAYDTDFDFVSLNQL